MTSSKANLRDELETQAKASATAHVINMFQRPGQLEKVEQYRRRLARKKASVEALLKSAMQQQLDGVRTGLNELHSCLEDVLEIDSNLKFMYSLFGEVPNIENNLNEVREENMRHSQYVTAIENLKHIFTVPESVEKTKQWINDGKLLHTHQCLRDLENSRDDLLYELHKLPNQSPHDKSMLKAYFADVEVLSNLLEKQIRLILSRTLNTVRKEPTVIVTALRIIEREEKTDYEALKQEKQTGFLPPGRPKRWRSMAFEVLEKAVSSRIEGTQVDEREDDKHWLIRYLELTRLLILEDLRVVKTLCVPCFPPNYHITERYIQMYHECLSKHLQDLIQNGLEGNEHVTVLSWVQKTYRGEELLGHSDLAEHTHELGPLLPDVVIQELENQYMASMERNYTEWMRNTLAAEEEEWRSNVEPADSYSRTAAPIIIFQMIDQNLQVTKTITDELTIKVLNLSIDQVILYGDNYRKAITDFKIKYFEDRKQVPYFTQYMITILNNCLQLTELGSQLEKQYFSKSNSNDIFNRLRSTFIQLRNDAGDYLLEELFLDLERHFDELFTSRWLTITLPIDTICATLDDYFQDYNRLVESNYRFIIHQAKNLVAKRYLTSLLSKRTTFKTLDESTQAANKVLKEITQLRKLFHSLCANLDDSVNNDSFEAIVLMSELLKSDDDMLSFELHRVVEKYTDINDDHLMRLMSLRGDLNKADIKDKIAHVPRAKAGLQQNSIFKTLVFPKLVNLNVFNT